MKRSAYLQVLAVDDSIPIDREAVELWLRDLENPRRWWLQPVLQVVFAGVLYSVWFFKRLPLPQFRAHATLQRLICWFCKHFVSRDANLLILRHFATESNLLNFLIDNASSNGVHSVELYPQTLDAMREHSFVRHDQELFRTFIELGRSLQGDSQGRSLSWTHWRPVDMSQFSVEPRRTQVLDFESAHALFMALFCLLLTREEYRDAINGFNLDQSVAVRVGHLIGDTTLAEFAYNKYPQFLVGPRNLTQRFLMHGFFTEYLYAKVETVRRADELSSGAVAGSSESPPFVAQRTSAQA